MGKKEMGMKEMKMKKLNNKGFSLVELIVVIAIMAILAGALAPQFTKYIGKSREATDNQNIDLLITTTNAVLADPDVTPAAGNVLITSSAAPVFTDVGTTFEAAFKAAVGNKYPTPKVTNKDAFKIIITGSETTGWTVTCDSIKVTP